MKCWPWAHCFHNKNGPAIFRHDPHRGYFRELRCCRCGKEKRTWDSIT